MDNALGCQSHGWLVHLHCVSDRVSREKRRLWRTSLLLQEDSNHRRRRVPCCVMTQVKRKNHMRCFPNKAWCKTRGNHIQCWARTLRTGLLAVLRGAIGRDSNGAKLASRTERSDRTLLGFDMGVVTWHNPQNHRTHADHQPSCMAPLHIGPLA